jgi:hypothetical protein
MMEYRLRKLRLRFHKPHFELLYRQWLQDEGRLKRPAVEGCLSFRACPEVARTTQFKLVRKLFGEGDQQGYSELIPWTAILPSANRDRNSVKRSGDPRKTRIAVQYRAGRIKVMVDDREVGDVADDRLSSGMAGLAVFGRGVAAFDDLLVQSLR